MKHSMILILSFAASLASANPMTYHELTIKDLDEMVVLVREQVKKAKPSSDEPADLARLKDGVRMVYSRPDSDGMIEKVIGPLRSEVEDVADWDSTLGEMADESVAVLKDPGKMKADMQITHVIFLQNVIGSLKPKAKNDGPAKAALERIRDAEIELTKEARHERKLRIMKATASPSDLAAQALGKKTK